MNIDELIEKARLPDQEIMDIGLNTPWRSGSIFWADVGVKIAKAQAEISFKAGMKEVVEWVEKNLEEASNGNMILRIKDSYLNYYTDKWEIRINPDWQAKLKEWGL